MKLVKPRDIYACKTDFPESFNQRILEGFIRHRDDEDLKRTHYFHGRHENIYIPDQRIPEIGEIKNTVRALVAEITGIAVDRLKAGLWFNAMDPGQVTTMHRHDDYDEIMSSVYYVDVPENSGEVVLTEGRFIPRVKPEAGLFVLFPPDMAHEVTENRSSRMRLSLGINIGPVETD